MYYSGKKKGHSIKQQIVIGSKSRKILSTYMSKGKRHDFRIYKESGIRIGEEVKVYGDSAYYKGRKERK
jgi:hypothetical protein